VGARRTAGAGDSGGPFEPEAGARSMAALFSLGTFVYVSLDKSRKITLRYGELTILGAARLRTVPATLALLASLTSPADGPSAGAGLFSTLSIVVVARAVVGLPKVGNVWPVRSCDDLLVRGIYSISSSP
jgi:hypothetical protein